MTRLLAAAVFAAVLAVSAAPASAQYPYGGFYGGFGTVYTPQTYYGGYNNYSYGYNNNGYGYRSNYGSNQNYRSYNNHSHYHGGNYGNQSGYGVYRANGGPVTLPDGNTVSGFKNVIVLPPGYTVQGGF